MLLIKYDYHMHLGHQSGEREKLAYVILKSIIEE